MHALWSSDLAPLIFVAGFAAFSWLGYPIVQGIRRRLEGGRQDKLDAGEVRMLHDEVEQLREQLESMSALTNRMLELEERLDFAERVLTHERERPAIGPERQQEA